MSEDKEVSKPAEVTALRAALDGSEVGIFILGPDLTVEWLNETVAEYFGLSRESVLGSDKRAVLDSSIRSAVERPEQFTETVVSAYESDSYDVEFTCHVLPDGDRQERWLRHQSHPIPDGAYAGGRIEQYVDVTGQAREMERKTRAIEEAPIGITMTDPGRPDNPLVYANRSFLELTGYSREEVEEWNHRQLQGPDTREEPVAELRRAVDAGEATTVELRNYRKDGTQFWNRVSIAPIRDAGGAVTNWVGFQEDITARKRREKERAETAALLETLFETLPVGLLVGSTDRTVMTANERLFELFDVPETPAAVADTDCLELNRTLGGRTDDPDRFVERTVEITDAGEPVDAERMTLADGRTLERSYRPVDLSTGTGHLWVYRDVTESVRRTRELERRTDLFRKAQEAADVGAWEYDLRTGENTWTAQVYDIYGLPTDFEPTPEAGMAYYHPDDRDTIREAFDDAVSEGEPYEVELRLQAATGEQRWVRTSGVPQEVDGEIVRVRGAIQDITEQKQYERELERQNERLEEFVGVVSHDLRNPLQVARNALALAREDGDESHFERVERSHERMVTLIDDLLTLARQGEDVSELDVVDLETLTADCWRGIDTEAATLETDAARRIEADPTRVRQLLENLLGNAIDHGGSDVTVTVGTFEDGFYVADDGPGIPEEDRETVFEGGYTTRSDGTGFGLAIVQRIAEAHGWSVAVTDSDAGGARVEFAGVTFPDDG